jgi:hypothetical protein
MMLKSAKQRFPVEEPKGCNKLISRMDLFMRVHAKTDVINYLPVQKI